MEAPDFTPLVVFAVIGMVASAALVIGGVIFGAIKLLEALL